jgi:hypothetical protein
MPQQQQQQPQLSQFEIDIIRDHSEAREDARNFALYWDTESPSYNCFAYAVGEMGHFLTPNTMEEIEDTCTIGLT